MYMPIQYGDHCQSPLVGCKVARRTARSAKKKMFGSRYGRRYDDAPGHRFGTGFRGSRYPGANDIRRSFSRAPSTPKRKVPRIYELAHAKTTTSGPCGANCTYSRCAANDPCYAIPYYTRNEFQYNRTTKTIGPGIIPSPSLLRNTCSRMAQTRLQVPARARNSDVLPMFELECSPRDTPSESIRGGAGPTTKAVGSNTEALWCESSQEAVPTRMLKDHVNICSNNSIVERLNKQTSPIPVQIATPIVAPVRPPRPSPPQNLSKRDQQMIKWALQRQQLLPPKPKYGRVVSPPHVVTPPYVVTPPHVCESIPRPVISEVPISSPSVPTASTLPLPAPPQLELDHPPSQSSTLISLTSRRETPPRRLDLERQKWLPGSKLSPRLHTTSSTGPPVVKMTYPSRTISPQCQSPQAIHQADPTPPPVVTAPPTRPPTPPPAWLQSSSQAVSPFSDSDMATPDVDSGSGTPTRCMCTLCGKPGNASAMTVYENYNSNPLYDLLSPLQSPARDGRGVVTMGGGMFRVRTLALEVLVLLVLGGLVTLGLMAFVESVFEQYLTGSCGCSDSRVPLPQLMADGLKSAHLVNWVTCPLTRAE